MKIGTLVDAAIIASANEDDEEGEGQAQGPTSVSLLQSPFRCLRRYGPCRGGRRHGAHTEDGNAVPDALPDNPGEGFADSAYRGNHLGDAVRAKGGRPRIIATAMWGRDEAESSTPGTNRSTEFVVGSRRSSVPGNEATTFAGCDGEGWQRKPFKSAALRIAYSMKHRLMVASSPIVEAQRPFSGSPPEIHGGQCAMPYPRFSPPSQMCGSPEAAH